MTFKVESDLKEGDWTGLKFSPDGKMIMLTTNAAAITLLDAFKGTLIHTLRGHENSKRIELDATFSADAQYIFSGSTDSHIVVWSAVSGQKVARLASGHSPLIQKVLFNPRFFMLATACTTLVLPCYHRTECLREDALPQVLPRAASGLSSRAGVISVKMSYLHQNVSLFPLAVN
ncbi:unnamed protein product [Toxocara canis]|uniref:WD_REPEATS_REGION domain-containing protein n=1 Tax=Toxocara canis TaxID=6265 RepID=A0A183U5C2_TOXCA|nr:unnamed protein product [Toxocara canis]